MKTKKKKTPTAPRKGKDADLLDAPGMEELSRLTSSLLKVSKEELEKTEEEESKPRSK